MPDKSHYGAHRVELTPEVQQAYLSRLVEIREDNKAATAIEALVAGFRAAGIDVVDAHHSADYVAPHDAANCPGSDCPIYRQGGHRSADYASGAGQ